jgi:hypothetical protein
MSCVGSTGDFDLSAHQASASPSVNPVISSDVTSRTTAHIDDSGLAGNAHLSINWTAASSLATGDPANTGGFANTTYFLYGFVPRTSTTKWLVTSPRAARYRTTTRGMLITQ